MGRRFQHGHGLGSVLSGFFRRLVLPFFQSRGKKILANAVKTTVQVADDVLGLCKTLKESAKHRIPTGIKRTLLGLGPQSGSGVRRVRDSSATFSREIWLLFTKVLVNVQSPNWTCFLCHQLRVAWNRVVGSNTIL